jgi:hypothetical protein
MCVFRRQITQQKMSSSQRLHSPCNHSCQKATCGEDCGLCMIKMDNVRLPCGHSKDSAPCHLAQDVSKIMCGVVVEKRVPGCGHAIKAQCWRDVASKNFSCPAPCGTNLSCGHACPGSCGRCRLKNIDNALLRLLSAFDHQKCATICGRHHATCNHTCRRPCHDGTDCGPCPSYCEVNILIHPEEYMLITHRCALTTIFTPPPSCSQSLTAKVFYKTTTKVNLSLFFVTESSCLPESYLESAYTRGAGYYSPGICPKGYTSACSLNSIYVTSGVPPMAPGETAWQCCPRCVERSTFTSQTTTNALYFEAIIVAQFPRTTEFAKAAWRVQLQF